MSRQKQKRSRGLIFTDKGLQKLQSTISLHESRNQLRKKPTYEELSEITGLAYNTVFKVLKRKKGVDKRTLVQFFMAFDLELTGNDYTLLDSPSKHSNKSTVEWINWDDTIDVSNFYGRTAELATLKKWLVEDRCRLITIYGMGGIGKTTLSVSLVEQIKNRFEYVLFISLKKPPLLEKVLTDITQFLSDKQMSETKLSNSIKGSFSELFNYLRSHRCLIVLDEVETVMQAGVCSGYYQERYKNYSQLIRYMGEVSHQSCFLLITRELPKEAAILAGENMPIRLMKLNGLQPLEGQKILQGQNLLGTVSEQNVLIESSSGNPLALKEVAQIIRDTYKGNIGEFLQQDKSLCDNINNIILQHHTKLSLQEKEVYKQLAISPEPISLQQLQKRSSVISSTQITILESLIKRSLVIEKEGLFICEPLLNKYLKNEILQVDK